MTRLTRETRERCRRDALRIGAAGLIVSAVGVLIWPAIFLRSYLVAYLFSFGIGIGSLVILMIYHLTGGRWGSAIRRLLESGSRTLPCLTILFLPIVLGIRQIYPWSVAETGDPQLGPRALYLNVPQFLLRAAVYFACWLGLTYLLNRWSRRHDETGDPRLSDRMRTLSGPGLVVCGLTLTFASVDWLMSLQPQWYSTIFSMVFAGGHALTALAFALLLFVLLADQPPLADMATPETFVDLGNLLLAFVMFWAYVSFAQFLLIWMGNLPEEIAWYTPRLYGGWKWLALALVVFHFAVPFTLLLSRDVKRDRRWLASVAGLVLAMRLVALFWDVIPAYEPKGFWSHGPEIVASAVTMVGLSGVWLAVFFGELNKFAMVAAPSSSAKEVSTDE